MTKRELLASDIGAIGGVVFSDLSLDGLSFDDPRIENVQVQIFDDNNNLIGTDISDFNGEYRFDGLSEGTYFVEQSAAPGQIPPGVQTVFLDTNAADGESIVTIDAFTSGAQLVAASGGTTQVDSTDAPNALGGERDVQLEHTNGSGTATLEVDTATEMMSLSTGGGATAQAIVEYDGADNAFGLTLPPGFTPISLTGGQTLDNSGLELVVRADSQSEDLVVTIYSSATEASEATITIPQSATLQSVFARFDAINFSQSTAAGITDPADFENVVAVRAQASVTLADNNVFFSVVESRGSSLTTQDLANTPTVRNVDVAIDKQVSNNVVAGEDLIYTFVVTNAGPNAARDVEVFDTLPNELTFVSFDSQASGVTIAANGQDLTFTVGELAVGETQTFDILASVVPNATADISNTAVVTTSDNDIDPSNNSGIVTVTPGVAVDLILNKTANSANAVPGQDQLVYTLVVSHDTDSVSDATDVTVTDTLPAGLISAVINSPGATSSDFDPATQTIVITYATIPVGETRTITITADVQEDASGVLSNVSTVSTTLTDLDTTNNSDTATTTLDPQYDVTISKIADTTTPAPGANVTYSIGLTNSGPSTATGVVLTDDIPAGMTFVSGTIEGLAASSNGTTVTFPSITLGENETASATLVFTLDVAASGSVTNTAAVTADNGETDTTNNAASVTLTVSTNNAPTPVGTIPDQIGVDGAVLVPLDVSGFFTDVDANDSLVFTATTDLVTNPPPAGAGLINPSFEIPDLGDTATFQFLGQSSVPGWQTDATSGTIEVWANGFLGVTSFAGTQHAELNSDQASTLFQDTTGIAAGQIVGFEFAHRGRNGTDTMRLTITDLGSDNTLGGGDDNVLFTKEYSAGDQDWQLNNSAGEAPITALGNDIRFAYSAVSTATGNLTEGNFIDAANFGVGVGVPPFIPGLAINNAGVISGAFASNASQGSPYMVEITATDNGGATATQNFQWTVTNPPPTATDQNLAGDRNDLLSGNVILDDDGDGVDSDPDGDTLTVSAVNDLAGNVGINVAGSFGGTFNISPGGDYTFDPGTDFDSLADATATTSVTYTISDGEGGTDTATVTVIVSGTPDIKGHIFCDANGNGFEDGNEFAPNTPVFVDANDNRIFDQGEIQTLTDSAGDYELFSVPNGVNTVIAQTPVGCQSIPADPGFIRIDFDVGNLARSIVATDRDGDGDQDLLVAVDLDGTLIALNNEAGTLASREVIPIGEHPYAVAAQEFPGQPATIAVAAIGNATDGGGVFFGSGQQFQAMPAGNGPVDVVLTDFNNDGQLEALSASFRSGTLQIQTLGATESRTIDAEVSQIFSLDVGDLDGDGDDDIVVTGVGHGGGSNINVVLNEGGFQFSEPICPPDLRLQNTYVDVAAVDLNGDGIAEVVALDQSGILRSLTLVGSDLVSQSAIQVIGSPSNLAFGDFNNDRLPDVAVASAGLGAVELLLGTGGGEFSTLATVTGINTPTDLAVVDLEDDGFGELAILSMFGDNPGQTTPLPSSVTILKLDDQAQTVVVTDNVECVSVDFMFAGNADITLLDVNQDGVVSALDALNVINVLDNAIGEGELIRLSRQATDVNGDGATTAKDALAVINYLSRSNRAQQPSAHGERLDQRSQSSPDDDRNEQATAAVDEVFAGLF